MAGKEIDSQANNHVVDFSAIQKFASDSKVSCTVRSLPDSALTKIIGAV